MGSLFKQNGAKSRHLMSDDLSRAPIAYSKENDFLLDNICKIYSIIEKWANSIGEKCDPVLDEINGSETRYVDFQKLMELFIINGFTDTTLLVS